MSEKTIEDMADKCNEEVYLGVEFLFIGARRALGRDVQLAAHAAPLHPGEKLRVHPGRQTCGLSAGAGY